MREEVCVITGAGRGIGRAAAIELAKRGYRLALLSRTVHELDETARLTGTECFKMSVDVCDAEAVQAAIELVDGHFGRVDAIVHCAGLAPSLSVEQTTPQRWREVIETNLSSAFYLARAVWPVFRRLKGGVIVNISSAAARDPFPGFAAYASAKAGIHLLDRVLAREGLEIGVRVHTIAPAAVETAMLRKLLTPEQYPADQAMAPEDVANVIAACVVGDLRYSSGEVIYLQRTP